MATGAFEELLDFVRNRMRMSHIYQPVMLPVLLQNSGRAAIAEIAKAFAAEDRSQIEYYERIVKAMPGRVLKSNGIVERQGTDFALAKTFKGLTPEERHQLIAACQEKLVG